MNSENDGQMATSAEGQDTAQETSQDAKLDTQSTLSKEIENSKKQRAAKQAALSENEKLKAQINQFEEEKMVKEGKQSELIEKLKTENKSLSDKAKLFDSYKESEKQSLLANSSLSSSGNCSNIFCFSVSR